MRMMVHMRRRTVPILLAIALVCGASQALAHEHFRVIGTLTKLDKAEIEVKNAKGKVTPITVDKQTKVTRDKKSVPVSQLKVGQSVVVDAYGDDEFDLLALEVRIVPAIANKK